MQAKKTGVLLINIGTPSELSTASIRSYLNEFLSDPRVIDIHPIARFLLVKLLILPFRPARIIKYYRNIWTAKGSPLLLESENLRDQVAGDLGPNYQVEIAMRYGSPSLKVGLDRLADCASLILIPLYPQYAASSTASSLAKCYELLGANWDVRPLKTVGAFYDHPLFIKAVTAVIRDSVKDFAWDHILFSYHGLPERHMAKSHCAEIQGPCQSGPCPLLPSEPVGCYRFQSYATTALIAKEMGLTDSQYSVSFQSRLGRTPWIKPYTDQQLVELFERGVRHLAVATPSFVSDCLETLDEVGVRLRDQWLALGGKSFRAVPCVGAHPMLRQMLVEMVRG